jgi:uncharacterized protein (TIGR00369 family)
MVFEPLDKNFEARVKDSFSKQKFMGLLKAKLTRIEPGFCEIHVPYSADLTQQNNFFHAGIVGTVADNTAGYAGFSLMAAGSSVLTVEFKLNLINPADGELLIGQSQVLKYGRTITICRSEVFIVKNGQEKLCAAAQSTLIELNGHRETRDN